MRIADRGMQESTQWAILLPALLFCVLGLIQSGIWLHGKNVLSTAAAAAAEAESLPTATAGAGRRAAVAVTGPAGLTSVEVSVVRGPGRVDVLVAGTVPTFFDVGQGRITGRASAPSEGVRRP